MDLFELVAKKDNVALRAALAADPRTAESRNEAGASLLAWTAYTGNAEAQQMVRAGLQALDPYEATIVGDRDRVADLLANGWNGNELSPDGFTPLGLAAFFNREDVFDLLLPLTRDVNQRAENPQQVAAIHAAVSARSASMVEKLLVAGADPNRTQADSFTPLQGAAASGDVAIAAMLLLAGAAPGTKNAKGETAADLARSRGNDWLAERIEAMPHS